MPCLENAEHLQVLPRIDKGYIKRVGTTHSRICLSHFVDAGEMVSDKSSAAFGFLCFSSYSTRSPDPTLSAYGRHLLICSEFAFVSVSYRLLDLSGQHFFELDIGAKNAHWQNVCSLAVRFG